MSDYSYKNTTKKYSYKPIERLAKTTIVILGIFIFISLIALWSDGVEFSILHNLKNATDQEIDVSDMRQGIIGAIQTIFSIAYLVIFLIWLNRYSKNTHAISKSNLTYTPGWTVGYFFIPIMCLFRPYQAISELYMENVKKNNKLIIFWWGTWIISIAISRISMKTSIKSKTLEEFQLANSFTLIDDALDIICLSMLLYIVLTMTKHQVAKREAALKAPAPPELKAAQSDILHT